MAIKTFILENSSTKKQRQADIQNAVREFLKDKKVKITYDENGIPSVENTEKKLYLSITRAEKVMLAVLCDKPVGIDGEYLPRMTSPDNKVDYMMLAERFFSVEESEFVRESDSGKEAENFLRVWIRKEAYVKCVGKTIAEFPNFSVIDNSRFVPKLKGVSLKLFKINFPECDDYMFVIAGVE